MELVRCGLDIGWRPNWPGWPATLQLLLVLHHSLRNHAVSCVAVLDSGAMALFCGLLCCDDVSVRRVAAAALWHLETRLGGVGLKYKKELELLFDLLNMCMKEALGS